MTAPKSFSDLPSWQDIEQSEGFSALDQQKKNEAYDLWSSDYTRLAIENPDELNPGDWEFFKKANARKKAELSGSATPLDLDDAEDAPLDLQPKVSSLVGLANQFEELDKKYQVGQTTPEEWEAHDALKKVFTPEKKELAEKIKAIQTSSDDESMIHDGEFIASPSLLLKKKEYAEAIRNSTLTDEQKADALFQGRMLRDRVGSSLREQIRQVDEGMADAWLGGLNSFKEFEEIEKQRDPDLSDADIMEAWQRKTGMFSNMEAQFKLGLRGGFADLISTYYGLKQLTGLGDQETAMRMGQAALEAGQKLGAAGEAIGGATALKTLTQVGVGMLPQVISGGTAGMVTAAGRFALAGAGRIAATAGLRRAAVASVATRLGTEASKKLAAKAAARAATSTLAQTMILSGVQSAGASFQSTYDDYLREEVDMLPTAQKEDPQALALAKERARKSARGRSLVSGAVTGIVTGAFGLTGLESFGKAAKDVIARPGWQEAIKAGLGSYLIRTAGKEFSSEFSEEAIDNAANDLIDKIALGGDKPIGDIIKESLEAGIVGGVFGGGIGTAKALSDVYEARKQAKTNPNIRQQLEAAERAANAGLPAVSAVVREKAEAQVESLTQQQLDEKAAQQTAEAEKALQQPPAAEGAADPFAPPGEAQADEEAPVTTPTSVPDWVKESAAAAAAQVPAETQQRIKELAADRKTAKEIATETGLDVDTVQSLRVALGIPPWTSTTSIGNAPVENPEFTAWRKKFLSAPSVEAPSQPGSAPQPPVAKTAEERDIQSAEYTLKLATEWTNKNGAAFGVSEPAYIAFANDEGTDIHPPRMPQVLAEKARLEKIGYTFDLANRKPAKGGTHTGVIIPIIPLPPATVATPTPPVASLPRGQKKEAQPAASKSAFDSQGPGFGDKRTVRELAEQGGPGRDPLLVPRLPKFPIGDGAQVTTNTGETVTLNDDPRWDEGLNQWMYPTTVGAFQERNLVSVNKDAPMSGKALLGIPRGKPISGAVMTFTREDGPPTFTAAPPPTETVPAEAPAKAKAKRVRRTKAEAQPEPPKPSDTETKKPQASSVPPVEREPAVESPAGQAQEGTAPRTGEGQKAEARGVTKPEQPTSEEEVLTEPSEIVLKVAKRFGGRIAWSQGDLAIIEGFQLFGSKSLYIAVVGDRYSLTDFTLMESEQRKSLLGNNEDLFLRKREEIIEANNRMLAENPDGPFTNGQTTVVSKNVPQNTAAVFREWVRLLGLSAPTRIVLTTPQDAIDMASKYGGKFRRIGVTSLMRDNERGQMTPLGENDFHIFYKEDVSYARTLEVLAHELGHILERQAFENLPDDQRKAIITEHEKWLKRVGSQKALNGIRELRSMRTGKIHPSFSQMDDRFDSLGAYWTSFSEWFADQVARWATTTDKPLTVVEKFFARLGKKLREFFNLKGSQFAPNQQVSDWLNSLSPDLNAVVEATLAPAETTTKDSLPAGQAQEGAAPRIGKGQKAETRGVTKLRKAAVKEVAVKPAPVKAAAERVAKATTPFTKALATKVDFPPSGSSAQMADTYYPALEDLMFNDEMRVPNTAQINALLKANTGRGLPNGDPALTDLLVRLQTAWSAKYPSEKGVPDAFLVGAHKGSVRLALEEKSSKDKSTNEVNGVFPVKIVRGKKVGFFTNDPTLTARQFSAGLAPKIPASIIKSRKVHSNIKFDAEGNVTSVIHPKYDVEIKSLGQLRQVYRESPQKARKAEIRVGNIDKKLADAANKLGVSPDIVMDRLGELIASAENTRAIAIQNGSTQVLAIATANIAKYTEMLGSLQSATQPDMPSASFVGNLLADYPVPAPNEESLLSKYLLLDDKNQTTKLETMIRQTLNNKTLRAKGVAVEQEVLTGVINTALREIRAASSRNGGAEVDPAKLRPIRGIVENVVKETERKQLNHRSISTVSRDELNAEGAALIDPSDEAPNPAETMMVREEEELTNAPVSSELAAELKEGMLKLFPNQKISGPDSIEAQTQRLVQNPAQARRAAEFIKAKIPFSVGLDGELVFSYGKKLTGEELASLVKLMDKINIPATGLPKGEKTLLERLDKNPNVGRFFLEASLYLREVLLDVKMTDGSPMYTEAAINKKNFLELTRLAGTETTNRALDAARSNLDKYIDLPDVSLPRAMAVVTYALGGKRARVARTDRGTVRLVFDPRDPGYSSSAMLDKSSSEWASYDRQTRVLMTYQTEEEAKVHREVMVESLRGFVGTARTKMAALEERVKKAEEQLAYLKGTIPSLGEVGPPTQEAITKRTAEISRIERNRDGMVAEFSSLDDSVQQAEATLADIVAPPVSALPDSPEKAAIKEAFVKKLQRMSQVFKNQVERARAAGATESTRLARSVAISREVTATAPGSAWPRTIHETSLYDAGIKSGESAASLRSALSRLANTVDKNRPPAIQHLAKMIVDNQALMEGIEGVDVIHDPMLRMDAVVSEGILVINTASMPGTVMTEQEAKHLAVEAALRALIHNAAANLTAPDAVLTDSQRQALDNLEQLRQEAIEVERKTRPDGLQSRFAPHLKDVASFVSGVMTSPEFANMLQGYMTSVKTPGLKSVWGRFWKALANLLTGRDTAFGSALHASLMESGRLFALNPPPGPSVMDNMVAAMSDPGIAFPSSRTSQVAELAHIERVEEAMDTADSSEAITTAQDRLLGFGTGDTETEQANEGVLPDNMALGASGKVAKKKKPTRVAKAAPATPTPEAPATPTPTARAKKKAPSKKTPWQFFNSIKGATAVVQRAQQSVEGAEDVEMPSDEELNTSREQLCQKIQTLRNSSYSDKKSRIRALEKLVSQIDLHLSESPTPPLDTDSESVVAVAGETPEVLPPADEETEVEDALPETQTEEQAEEEAAESDEDPEQHQEAEPETAPINGAELSRQVSESTGYSVTFVVSAAPDSATSEPVFVTHDRNDRTIYVRNQQVENLIKQGMDAGMSREAAQKYAFEKVLEDAETMAIVHKFSDGELLRTYEEMTVKERQEIIKKVYGLKPGMPGYAEASGRSKNLSLEQMTQQRAAIAIHYLRRLRQLATTGFTTEDVVAMRNKPQSAVARAVAYLRASARQFFTRWNTYGNVYAVRAILNAEDFLTQLGESPVAGSSMLTDPGKIPAAEVVPTLARVLGKTSAEIEEDIEEGLRIRKLLLNDKDFGDENMTRPMEADEMTAFLDELGLKDGDPASVAEALRRISEMDGVDPVVQNVAKYLSEHADIANLAAFSTTMKGISVRSRNGQFVEPAGLYYSTQHALVINTNAEYPISKNSFIETFLHECTHATTSIAIQKYTNYKKSGSVGDAPLAPDTMKAVAELETILNGVRDFAKKNGDTQYDYRLSDVEEFVAGVLTDTRFTSWLSSVPNSAVAGVGSDSNTSLIKRILMRIYRIAWPDLDTNVTVMKSLDRIFNIAARPQVVITPVSPSKEVLGVFTPEQFAAAPERLRERQAGSEVLNVDYDAFIEKASSAISEASRDASANLPAVGTGVLAPSMTVVSEIDADYTVALQGDNGNDNLTEQLRAASKADRQKVLNDWVARNPQSAEMLQQRVDEAAKAAGYNVGPVWHYTAGDSADFNQFDKAKAELGAFFFSPENRNMSGRRDAKLKGKFYLSLNNPRVVTESKSVGGVDNPMAYYSSEGLSSRGFDGIVGTKGLPEGGREVVEYLVFEPNQIKSADPITYDDAGNVISLSQRFNPKSPDISANLPAVGNKQARRFVSDGDRQAMLERMRPTRALLNSIPGLAPSVQAMLAGAEYAGSVNSDDLSVVEARIGPALRSAVGPAEYQELAGRLADYNLTPVQSQIALAVIVKGLNDRLVSLSSMGVKSSARFAVERDFARTAEILSRRLQDIRSNNAQELQIGNLIRNILNPAYAARTYRTSMVDKAREMLEGSPETAAAVETVKGIATAAADEAAATAVRRSTLPRRVAEAGGRAAGADPEMVQTMFDFMEELASLQARGTIQTSGLPIPADMANWVADRMVQMMKGRLTKAGSDERTFLEEYSDEVRRQVATRINTVLKEGADAGESAPSLVDRLITSLEFAPMVESALNQSREAILARLVPGPDATPEQIAAYDDARTRLAGLTYDIVPLDTAIKVVRKSFNMRQQVLLELTDQHTSLEALTAMIAESADLSETQAAALAKSFRTAYEAEARRVTEKMLKDYAQRIKDAKIRGPVEKLTKSEKFLQLARLGGLRDEEVYDAMAKEFGLPSYDPEVAARLDAEAVRISEMPQGSVQRLDATRELNASVVRELFNQLLSAQGVSALRKNPEMFWKYLRDIPISMWKSGVLSGFGTQQVNFAMGTIQSVMDLSFNSVAYAVKAKDPSLAAGNFLTLLRSIGWVFDPATRKETWLEMKRAAMTGRTRFASEQSENMLVLEQDIPPPDIPVVKQLMSGTKNFFKLLGRLISIVDATVSVPAYVARQRMALAYAMSMQGIQGKHAADLMRASFSPDEATMREINAIVESERPHFSNSPRPDLAMQARRMQLLEQRRAELYDKITDGMSDIDRESFIEASRESASFANLSGKPVGIMGAVFDGCFGQLERATGGATSILFSFVKAMANMFDFSAAMSFPLGAISFARAFNASPSALMDQNNKYRRKRVERGSVEFYKLITQGFAALAIQSTVAALYVAGLEDEKEDREPYFMVYGEGPADPELAAQLRYRQPRWKPYTLKVGSLYLNWKDLPGFNIMMSGLAAVTDGMMNSKTKDPSKLRSERETVKYAIGLVRSVIAKNSMQGIMDAAEILSDNTIAKASADVKAVKMATNFVSGVTNPRLIRDIADIGRGIAGGGEFALPQVSNYSQALQTLVPGHTVTTDTDAMVNMVGRPITNFWFAPLTKRLLPMTADDGYDPILTPLVSAGLEVSPVKSSAKIATLKSDSDEIDPAGGTLGSFSPEVQVKASKLFGDYLDRTMTQKYIEDVTRRGRLGGESLKAAQEEIDRLCTDARKYATDMIESEVLQRKIKPHWQE